MSTTHDPSEDEPAPASAGRLRITLATLALAGVGGSETYALTVAHELERLGHEVTLFAERLGPVADLAEHEGLRVARDPRSLPAVADALLVQDRITAEVLSRYPRARVVHVCHSDIFDHQLPMLVSGAVDATVVLSERMAERVRALALDAPMVRLRQPIATDRFRPASPLPARPRRAVLLGNYLDGGRRAALIKAWGSRDVQCTQVGASGGTELDVIPAIAAADIVVAKGRAALEGMCCGRAVYIYDGFGGDGWVTAESYPALEADAFAGLATPTPRTAADLVADLDLYDPDMGWANTELVRANHSARRHAARLVALLTDADVRQRPAVDAIQEIARLGRLLQLAENRSQSLASGYAASRDAGLQETARWCQSAADAEQRSRDHALEAEGWRERGLEAESQLAAARWLLATRRAQVGMTAGRALDRLRRRR